MRPSSRPKSARSLPCGAASSPAARLMSAATRQMRSSLLVASDAKIAMRAISSTVSTGRGNATRPAAPDVTRPPTAVDSPRSEGADAMDADRVIEARRLPRAPPRTRRTRPRIGLMELLEQLGRDLGALVVCETRLAAVAAPAGAPACGTRRRRGGRRRASRCSRRSSSPTSRRARAFDGDARLGRGARRSPAAGPRSACVLALFLRRAPGRLAAGRRRRRKRRARRPSRRCARRSNGSSPLVTREIALASVPMADDIAAGMVDAGGELIENADDIVEAMTRGHARRPRRQPDVGRRAHARTARHQGRHDRAQALSRPPTIGAIRRHNRAWRARGGRGTSWSAASRPRSSRARRLGRLGAAHVRLADGDRRRAGRLAARRRERAAPPRPRRPCDRQRDVVASGLAKPYAVARGALGSVFVTDAGALKRIDGARAPTTVAHAAEDIGPIALAPNGDLWFTT